MAFVNNPELIRALATWVGQLKNPYLPNPPGRTMPVKLFSSSPHVWIEICSINRNQMKVTCIHRMMYVQDKPSSKVRHGFQQFNQLMEQVQLPVLVWENSTQKEFQLRWQEILNTQADLGYVQQLLEQSMFLASALETRLGLLTPQHAQAPVH